MYDSKTGRWMQQDPIGFAGGDANLYRYVGNSPTNYTDPAGLDEKKPKTEPAPPPTRLPAEGVDGNWVGGVPDPDGVFILRGCSKTQVFLKQGDGKEAIPHRSVE
jgi:uncharacterized protein RhaS with RHS repeats